MTMLTITIIIMISTKIFQNITEKLEKVTYFVFTIFGVLLPLKVLCHPLVRKDVIKVQQIISKHKQAFIPTAI